jgi:YD repeat-containing protein
MLVPLSDLFQPISSLSVSLPCGPACHHLPPASSHLPSMATTKLAWHKAGARVARAHRASPARRGAVVARAWTAPVWCQDSAAAASSSISVDLLAAGVDPVAARSLPPFARASPSSIRHGCRREAQLLPAAWGWLRREEGSMAGWRRCRDRRKGKRSHGQVTAHGEVMARVRGGVCGEEGVWLGCPGRRMNKASNYHGDSLPDFQKQRPARLVGGWG